MNQAPLSVVHAMPGRLRLRLPARAETSGLGEAARGCSGVTDCKWNERTRSLLIVYRPDETTAAALVDAVAAHAHIEAAADIAVPTAPGETVTAAVTSVVGDLNSRVARATAGRLDLGVILPIALAAWALRDLLRGRAAPLAWSSALWYAHGLFRDYAFRERP